MKRRRSAAAAAAVAAGAGVILIANAMILGAAAWNRWGGPRTTMELTERELALPLEREPEDTGILLSLVSGDRPPAAAARAAWKMDRRIPPVQHKWLDRAKLRELGFAVDLDPADPEAVDYYAWAFPREVYVTFEFDGPAFGDWLAEQEQRVEKLRGDVETSLKSRDELADAEALLAFDRTMRSRLFPVDAGRDPLELARRRPDRERCVILPTTMRVTRLESKGQPPELRGSITDLSVADVHAPLRLHPQLERFLPRETQTEAETRAQRQPRMEWPIPSPPRYRALVAFGRRFEPWLVDVTPASSGDRK